ncbi:MAG: fumarate hydratase [Methanimicrococcus sp.]|nr:fumarate hydratase [Methanimicrococcus sp.]
MSFEKSQIKTLSFEGVSEAVVEILKEAETKLPQDTVLAIQKAMERETNAVAKAQLESILKNIEIAEKKCVPICQDTGIFIFFVEIGRRLCLDFDLEGAIRDGCKKATELIPLRPNVVDPLTRHNTKNNVGDGLPEINYKFTDGSALKITVAPKGAGSENMSALKMFTPTEIPKIKEFIVKTVLDAGGKPCPPLVVGVGIGGSFNQCAKLAKEALLENLREPEAHEPFEKEILDAINALGIGCMGLGGDTTALSVRIKKASCHTASLPAAVNIQCWANRHATAIYNKNDVGGEE